MKVSIIGAGGLVGSSAAFALQTGGVVRELALLDGERRSATVTTIGPCELLVLHHRDFQQLLRQHQLIGLKPGGTLLKKVAMS